MPFGRFGMQQPPEIVLPPPQPQAPQPAAAAANNGPPAEPPKSFIETSGANLSNGGVPQLEKQLEELDKAGGGVLFVDEAYMLEPTGQGTGQGKQVLNLLLQEMERKRGSLIIIFAGYKRQMEKMFEYNEGLPSRFAGTIAFADFDDKQLLDIFKGFMKKNGGRQALQFEGGDDKWGMVMIRRLALTRGTPAFGNGRAVRNLFDRVISRQADRWAKDKKVEMFTLTKSDLLGPSAAEAAKNSKAWAKLKSMIGLKRIKESVHQLYDVVKANEQLEMENRPRQGLALNRLFIGNPGTGKTTVAKLYAEILRDFGLLSKGDMVLKAPSDFIGSVIGESGKNTTAILRQAEGCVLVIDEAYGLHDVKDPYKVQVITTIVEQVQAVIGENKCVVMLGYKEQMEQMMRENNPGLQRRFQLENAFYFDDYTNDELAEILKLKMSELQVTAKLDALMAAIDRLAIQRDTRPPFGNGGAVANLLSEAIQRKAGRGAATSRELLLADLAPPDEEAENDTNEENLFKGLIGCDEIVELLRGYKQTFLRAKERGQDPLKKLSLNFRFVGSPGTGKTTVANRMGRMFRGLGVLPSSEVVICSGTDLIGQYVGQSAPRMREMMDKALGKVLFIDEAYGLASTVGGFGQESIDELVRCMTADNYFNNMVILVAGYEKDIDRLMQANEGLRSRFDQIIKFRNFNVKDSIELFKMRLMDAEVGLKLSLAAERALATQIARIVSHNRFANGRDIVSWVKRLDRHMAMQPEGPVEAEDLEVTISKLLEGINPPPGAQAAEVRVQMPPVQVQLGTAPPPPKMGQVFDFDQLGADEEEPDHENHDYEAEKQDYFGMDIAKELRPFNDVVSHLSEEELDLLQNLSDLEASPLAKSVVQRLERTVGSRQKAIEIVKKWQNARQAAKKEEVDKQTEAQARGQKIRLHIKCAICGAPFCPVAPYVWKVEVVED